MSIRNENLKLPVAICVLETFVLKLPGQVDELLIMVRLLDEFVDKIISIIIAVCILIALNFMFFNIF